MECVVNVGSRHLARVASLIYFPGSQIYFYVGGRPKSIAKLDRVPWPDSMGSATVCGALNVIG